MGLKVAVPEKHKNAEKTRPPKAISLKKVTQFGFKIRSDSCSENKLDQIKAVAAKTKVQQDNRAEQRSILKGVRSNKRFELLMKMRKKDYKDPVMLKRRDTYELEESVADYKDPVMNKRRETYELEESEIV
ncbi:hypothetical protein WA026_005195 [Henosepilachna vigintioctopunctata]|uniref:Uncharacterized protein n=1 Tax=Henosepilachna vigintioctopunctata TaxID=420089 RepID=A0AAW1UP06_9CUCU